MGGREGGRDLLVYTHRVWVPLLLCSTPGYSPRVLPEGQLNEGQRTMGAAGRQGNRVQRRRGGGTYRQPLRLEARPGSVTGPGGPQHPSIRGWIATLPPRPRSGQNAPEAVMICHPCHTRVSLSSISFFCNACLSVCSDCSFSLMFRVMVLQRNGAGQCTEAPPPTTKLRQPSAPGQSQRRNARRQRGTVRWCSGHRTRPAAFVTCRYLCCTGVRLERGAARRRSIAPICWSLPSVCLRAPRSAHGTAGDVRNPHIYRHHQRPAPPPPQRGMGRWT